MKILLDMIRGFCMALADSVPGVSGGTIAFLMGFYDKFINSLNNIIGKNHKKRKDAAIFLVKLLSGWAIGFIASALILANIFNTHIYSISSLFLGFIIFAIPIIVKEEKETLKGKYLNIIFTILGIGIVVLISVLNPASGGEGIKVDAGSLNIGIILYVFVAAMIAICAMVLPGISGSTLLLIFGLYVPIMTAIKEVLHLNLAYFPILVVFGLGVLTGILTTIKLIKKSLEKYRTQTIYFILGLMIGSIYPVILGPTTLEVPQDALSIKTFSIIFFIIGGAVIFGMQKFKEIVEKNQQKNNKNGINAN